jgi:hypothetical protein
MEEQMQALQIATPDTDEEQRLTASVKQLVDAASDTIIMSREDYSEATDLVKLIKTRHKEIEDERTRIVKPINDSVKHINDRFKQMTSPLAEAEQAVKNKMLDFQRKEEEKARKEREEAERKHREEMAAQEAAARKAIEESGETYDRATPPVMPTLAPNLPPAPPKTTYGQYGSTSTVKKVWAWDLVDIAALAAARPDLVTVDSAKVNAEIRGKGGNIPGLRIFEKDTIAVR